MTENPGKETEFNETNGKSSNNENVLATIEFAPSQFQTEEQKKSLSWVRFLCSSTFLPS